jgi:hypothetical protein
MFGNPSSSGALNLGASSMVAQPAMSNPFASQGMQQMSQSPFMGGMAGGMGMQQNMMQQPMAPPSEMEIQLALMRTLAPIDRFVAGPSMATLVKMLNDLMSFSILEILKSATFKLDDEGVMKMDITSLPPHLQTMSAENVTTQYNSLQMVSQQSIQQAEMQQQQIAAFAQQSMMGGALSAALANEGLMDRAGGAAGKFMGSFMGVR